jgi:hypothetical protein
MKVSEISKELSKIWGDLEASNKMRASLFNLIVITPKNQRTPYIRDITQKVLKRFPSRLIFAMIDNLSNTFNATVSIVEEATVVCDQIEIEVSKDTQAKLPFVILPHLLPDLPVYLLWVEDPIKDNPLSHQLEQLATRAIFDSEVTDNLTAFAKTLLQHNKSCDIADLNWARTESWRELLASTFYSKSRLASLSHAKKICITYNSFETDFFCHTKIQAIYLQTWLISQLQIEPKIIELVPETNSHLPPGTVISIDIFTPPQIHYAFCRDAKQPYQIKTIVCDEEKCEIPSKYIFTKSQSGLSLVNEICHNGTSQHFLKVLESIAGGVS